jgi:hypothetical protein
MNLFKGLTEAQIVSFFLMFALFNAFVVLEAIALAAFFVTSRPIAGRVRSAAVWHVVAAAWFMLCFVSTVWAAPAEKSFVNPQGTLFDPRYDRFQKVIVGLVFAAIGIVCLAVGALRGIQQKRAWREQAFAV